MDVVIELLTNEPSGRLYKSLVETKKASQQYGYSFTTKDPGYVYFAAELLKEKSLDDAKTPCSARWIRWRSKLRRKKKLTAPKPSC